MAITGIPLLVVLCESFFFRPDSTYDCIIILNSDRREVALCIRYKDIGEKRKRRKNEFFYIKEICQQRTNRAEIVSDSLDLRQPNTLVHLSCILSHVGLSH